MRRLLLIPLLLVISFCKPFSKAASPHTWWVHDFDDPNLGPRLFLSTGPDGSVYFASSKNLTVGRFDPAGNLLFRTNLLSSGTPEITARTTDPQQNLILCGKFMGELNGVSVFNAPLLLKVSPAGEIIWGRSALSTGRASLGTVCTDPTGNIYTAGYFIGKLDFGSTNINNPEWTANDAFLAKYSRDGEFLWALTRSGSDYDYFRSLSVDAAGDLWASTHHPSYDFISASNTYIEKFKPDGELIFKKQHDGMDLFATGTLEPFMWNSYSRFYPSPPQEYSSDPQLGRFRTDGDIRWFTEGFGGHGHQGFFEPAQDSEYSTYFLGVGTFAAASVGGVGFPEGKSKTTLTKLNLNGQTQWGKAIYGLDQSGLHSLAIADPSTLFVSGVYATSPGLGVAEIDYFSLPRTNRSIFIAKLGPLNPNAKPILALPPRDLELIEGHTGYIVAGAASVLQPTFQWFLNNVELPGETNTFITLSPVHRSHGGEYKIRISNNNGEVISTPIRLTVRIPPSILEHPVSQTASAGENITLRATAVGDTPLSYEWRFKGAPLSEQKNDTLDLNNLTYFQQGEYQLVVTNLYGSAFSETSYLTVLSPPILSRSNYFERPIIAGVDLSLGADIAGTEPLQYQWYEKGIPISGATDSFLPLPGNYSDGPFSVIAFNQFGSITNDLLWPLRLMYPLSILATNQTNAARFLALAHAGEDEFFALRAPANETSGNFSFIERFDLGLRTVWPAPLQISGVYAFPRAIFSDPETNLFVLGDFRGEIKIGTRTTQSPTFTPSLFLASLSSSGEPKWVKPFGLAGTNKAGKIHASQGALWTVGDNLVSRRIQPNQPLLTFTNLHLAQFDFAGNLLWSNTITSFPAPESWTNPPSGLLFGDFALDAATNFFVAGTLKDLALNRTPLEVAALIKYDLSGQILWSKFFTSTNPRERFSRMSTVKIAPDGDIFATGFFNGLNTTAFLTRLAPNGDQRWIVDAPTQFGVTGDGTIFQTLDFLPNGHLIIGGQAFGSFRIENDFYNQGGFALEFSPDGKLISPTSFGLNGTFVLDLLHFKDRLITAGHFRRFQSEPPRAQLHLLGPLPPKVTNQFRHYIFSQPEPIALRPRISGTGPISFQWLLNGEPLPGKTNSFLNLDTANQTLSGLYQLVVQNQVGTVTNQAISVSSFRLNFDNSQPTFTLALPEGQNYRIEFRDSLNPEFPWTPWINLTGSGNPISTEDKERRTHRFYRLIPQ